MALNKKQISMFKKKLEEMREHLIRSLKGVTEDVKEIDESAGYSQHQADEGTDDFGRTVAFELSSKEYEILRLIDRALEKIKTDTYGICDVTNKQIPIARLEAVPYATMTVEAQERLEKGLL